jgi:hypothetical protein
VFKSSLNPSTDDEITRSLGTHGDAVKDVALSVNDLEAIVAKAREAGAKVVRDIWEEKDENGYVRMATVQTVTTTDTRCCVVALLRCCSSSFYFIIFLLISSATSLTRSSIARTTLASSCLASSLTTTPAIHTRHFCMFFSMMLLFVCYFLLFLSFYSISSSIHQLL